MRYLALLLMLLGFAHKECKIMTKKARTENIGKGFTTVIPGPNGAYLFTNGQDIYWQWQECK